MVFQFLGFLVSPFICFPNNLIPNAFPFNQFIRLELPWTYLKSGDSTFQTFTLSQPHFEGSVRSPLTLPKMGLGSPSGLPKTQSAIAGVKTPRIKTFFIPLKRSWSVDVQNGLIWTIWTFVAQVMVERRVGSQNDSLTPDH